MKLSGWQLVAVVAVIVAGIVTLAALGRDTAVLAGIGIAILAGVGVIAGQQSGIKDNTNGNAARQMALIEWMAGQLAQAQPIRTQATVGSTLEGEETDAP